MKPSIFVLLVEDNAADAQLVQIHMNRIISDYKYEIKVSTGLEEAVNILANLRPDVIVLDLTLPKTSGIDTYRAVRLAQPGTPVLILTGLYDKELALQAVAEGAGWYMLKSAIRADTLELNIHLAMQVHRLNQLRQQGDKVRAMAEDYQHSQLLNFPHVIVACSKCGKIRDESILIESGDLNLKWLPVQVYLIKNGLDISHSYCPKCMADEVGKVVAEEP